MMRILISVALVLGLWCTAFAQAGSQEIRDQKLMEKAAANGTGLPTQTTVATSVSAQAVLIPQIDARRIFGKEIADNYAVIEVNVGNKSPDAALIIHGVFIDYSRWALSGINGQSPITAEGVTQNPFAQYQTSTNTNHVASEEYRVVRGQLLDAQNSTWRNRILRMLTFAGNLAGAFTFSLSEKGIIQGIGAATGVGIPGFATAFPDSTVAQLNRVSDFGYKTNKVIPKESAEIIVCFFPIDRFLTPGFKKLFLKSPALFFNPKQMLLDRTIEGDVKQVLGNEFGDSQTKFVDLRNASACYDRLVQQRGNGLIPGVNHATIDQMADKQCLETFGLKSDSTGLAFVDTSADTKKKFAKFLILDYISQMSLNSVSVTVDGAMTLDTSSMAAKLEGMKFDQLKDCGDQTPCFWSDLTVQAGSRAGTIFGSYLTGGRIEIAEAKDLGITDLTTVSEGSNDQVLNFSFKLSKPVPTGAKLHFKVTKALTGAASLNANTTESRQLEYVVSGPVITDITYDPTSRALTLTGKGFITAPLSLSVKLGPLTGDDKGLAPFLDPTSNDKVLVFNIPAGEISGCWKVLVSVGGQPVKMPDKNSILVQPVLTKATLRGSQITVVGTGLDGRNCSGEPMSFTLVNGDKSKPVTKDATSTATNVTFALPDGTDKDWKVKAVFDGKALAKSPLTLEVTP